MKMNNTSKVILVAFAVCCICTPLAGQTSRQSQQSDTQRLENLILSSQQETQKNSEAVIQLEKTDAISTAKIESLDKRFDDVGRAVDRMSIYISFLGIIIGIAGVGIPIFVSFRVSREAKENAERVISREALKLDKKLQSSYENQAKELNEIIIRGQKEIDLISEIRRESQEKTKVTTEKHTSSESRSSEPILSEESNELVKSFAKLMQDGINYGNNNDLIKSFECFGDAFSLAPNDKARLYALFNKALTSHQLGQHKAAVDMYREAVKIYEASDADIDFSAISMVRFNLAHTLDEIGITDEALIEIDKLIDSARNRESGEDFGHLAKALAFKASTQEKSGDSTAAEKTFQYMINQYSEVFNRDSDFSIAQDYTSYAHLELGILYEKQKRYDDAAKIYEKIIKDCSHIKTIEVQETYAKALSFLADTYETLERYDEAISIADRLIYEFPNTENNDIRYQVASSHLTKALALSSLNQREDEVEAYSEFIRKYWDDPDNRIQVEVARALYFKYISEDILDSKEAEKTYSQLLKRYAKNDDASIKRIISQAKKWRRKFHKKSTTPAAGSPDPS
jgi:tetratricopeptide (TPR) repeat protein